MSTVSPVDQDDFSRGGRPKRVGLLFLCLLTSERGPFLVPSAVEGAREGAGANKESGGRFAH